MKNTFVLASVLSTQIVLVCGAVPYRPVAIHIPLQAPDSSKLKFTDVFAGVTFNKPVFMTFAPGDAKRAFVVEQGGTIKAVTLARGRATAQVFADLTRTVTYDGAEMGLLGLAFSPDFATTKEFFVAYTVSNPNGTVVSRMKVSATNANQADPQSLATVIETRKTFANYPNHNGGMIAFGSDRMLYLSIGDGGSGGDPFGNGQKKSVLFGKILRIDPLSAKPYAIPPDNPFANEGGDTRGEIWSYGMRNTWRFSFDRQTHELYAGDVGQDAYEEIDIIKKGGNYGWNLFEGKHEYDNPDHKMPADYVAPIWEYPHGPETSIIGGYVYRGSLIPDLQGKYLYSDNGSGRVWALKVENGNALSNEEVGNNISQPSAFAEDPAGELYILSLATGKVYRIEKNTTTTPTQMPKLLSQLGIFSSLAQLTAIDGLEPYDVAAPLWSDGAAKRRWIGLPTTGTIQFSDTGIWSFPVGTVFVKHFELATQDNQNRRVETRVFFHHNEGWRGYTYKWRDDASDADLLTASQTQDFQVQENGQVHLQTWYYPSPNDCLRCHNFSAGAILGANTGQLNHVFNGENILDRMNRFQVFSHSIAASSTYQHYSNPADSTLLLQPRLRSYLAANCAQCHNATGPAPGAIDFRFNVTDQQMNVIDVPATEGDLQSHATLYRVKSGDPDASALYLRMQSLDPTTRMPPLATSVHDDTGLAVVHDWIQALTN